MFSPSPLVIIAILFAALAGIFLVAAITAVKDKKLFGTALNFLVMLLMLALFALFGTISVSIQGYHALTSEELAATVRIYPAGYQHFAARFSFPDGGEKTFLLAGDQIDVDARILKWKPIANLLGLHTVYELDRVSGRYENIRDETNKTRTVFSLSRERPVDLFELRRRFAILSHLVDADYGSATFINTNRAEEFHVMVSTTGLLIRPVEKPSK